MFYEPKCFDPAACCGCTSCSNGCTHSRWRRRSAGRENEVLVLRPEEDGATIAAVEDGDYDALPPAFFVEGVHLPRAAAALRLRGWRRRGEGEASCTTSPALGGARWQCNRSHGIPRSRSSLLKGSPEESPFSGIIRFFISLERERLSSGFTLLVFPRFLSSYFNLQIYIHNIKYYFKINYKVHI